MIEQQVQLRPACELSNAAPKTGWRARLRLDYSRDSNARSYLSRKVHSGPLAVQKALYPEGAAVCHTLILHPPGGIVGGDSMDIGVSVQTGSHALITMPGAAKWYRSAGSVALQQLSISVEPGALLEWLPQETIMFNGAIARLKTDIALVEGGNYLGWDIMCLGRSGSGETFDTGVIHQTTDISIGDELIWSDRCRMSGASALLTSPVGLAGAPVSGIMIAAGKNIPAALLAQCREVMVDAPARVGISVMPSILVARYVGASCEQAKGYFIELWRQLRPFLAGRSAVLPRIWST